MIEQQGYVVVSDTLQVVKEEMKLDQLPQKIQHNYRNYATRKMNDKYCSVYQKEKKDFGTMFYDSKKLTKEAAEIICDLLIMIKEKEKSIQELTTKAHTAKEIHTQLQNHAKSLPTLGRFDFRSCMDEPNKSGIHIFKGSSS